MYQITPISDTIKSRYPQLKDYYLCQFLGENQQSAIICSILHYLLNRRLSRSLEYFRSPKINYKQLHAQEIAQFLQESLEMENPIQNFFEKLSTYDQNNLMTEVLLQDFCFSYQLIYKGQICLNYLADFLDLNINIIPQLNSLGRGNSNLIIIREQEEYYFIIPEPQFQLETQTICFSCSRKVYVFLNLQCDHQICLNCLFKQNQQSYTDNFQCRCGQVIQKQQVEQFQNEISAIAKTNRYNLVLEQFYHQCSSTLVQRKSQIRTSFAKQLNESISEQLTATEIQISLLDETNRVLEQLDEHCCNCHGESNKPYFYLNNCSHKFCFECIKKEFQNDCCGGCYCMVCPNKVSRKEYELYLQMINVAKDNIQEKPPEKEKTENKCQNCNNKFQYQLFAIENCKHSFCDTCLEQFFAVNYFQVYYCTVPNCPGTYNKKDYEKFKQEFRKQLQISYSELENSCHQISCDFNLLNNCKQCLKQLCVSQSEIKDQICSNCSNPTLKSKNLIENDSTKITSDDQKEIDLNWSLLIDKCQKCQKESQYQLFQIPLCNHKFCNSCIQGSIENKQKDQRCLNKNCKSLFTRGSYQNYYNNLLQDKEIIQNNQQILNQQLITKSETFKQQPKINNLVNLNFNSNVTVQSSTTSTTDQQLCSFCNILSDLDQVFLIKCGHQICQRCSLRLKGQNFRCSKCLTLFDNLRFKKFRLSCKYKCDNCKKTFPFDQISPNQKCLHSLCWQCLQIIYTNKETQYCCVKNCKKSFTVEKGSKNIQIFPQQDVDSSKEAQQILNLKFVTSQKIIQSNSQAIAKIDQSLSILLEQKKQKQEIEQPFKIQSCMICNQDFDDYNLPVVFSCNLHIIGICCILNNYQLCYLCDRGL
ncbi:unnamed protein product (macronuclear) [Paramecium tetraurelia]|uniref:RING-type domain-containing protein n=1 Tax=Paramecium tetraurelia TaxID=5888 RepID=A0CF52_PARTE|nr:uncharacterized protein GSPATT00037858001 [Paramecium tetraurelia]CAK69419.1 unnamed protein product [Paramecium tetraurelia]|eukprot:XP_001436816.1 hypothetical protein (macronuclear) [Paramecium tetraurelia strain d4-2]